MLIEFTVGNFFSFREKARLSMIPYGRLQDHRDTNLIQAPENISLLKSSAIYGANASGKTNFIHAIRIMRNLVRNSFSDFEPNETLPIRNFKLSTETESKPSFFEMTFFQDGVIYRYGFEADSATIHKEWLYGSTKLNGKETPYFDRVGNEFKIFPAFKEGERLNAVKDANSLVRTNALFLSVSAQFNGELSSRIQKWFRDLIIIHANPSTYDRVSLMRLQDANDAECKRELVRFLQAADLGIDDISIVQPKPENLPTQMSERMRADILAGKNVRFHEKKALHKKYDAQNKAVSTESFDLDNDESAGTKKLFMLSGPILDALKNGSVLIADELDARLHPLITQHLVRLFNSAGNKKAQLIFVTHDVTILRNKFFRKDQIWFTEKDRYGASSLYSLIEYATKVRNDASYGKDYLLGKYGAIPILRQFH